MTERSAPPPLRLAGMGLGMRDSRTRLECLRMAADMGGSPTEILERARAFVRHLEEADSQTRDYRQICLRIAAHTLVDIRDGHDVVGMASAFENFVLRRDDAAPA